MIPRLMTDRLILRGYTPADNPVALGLWTDPEVTRHNGGPLEPDFAAGRIAAMLAQWAQRGYGMFALENRADGAFVGHAGISHPLTRPQPVIGWALLLAYWGQGYATEAANAVLGFTFGQLGWPKISTIIDQPNAASIRVAERLGGVFEGFEDECGDTVCRYNFYPSSKTSH